MIRINPFNLGFGQILPRAAFLSAPAAVCLVPIILLLHVGLAAAYSGAVIDAATEQPIAGAIVTLGSSSVRTDSEGAFQIDGLGTHLGFRAYGYLRDERALPVPDRNALEISLRPFSPRAVFLSLRAFADPQLRDKLAGLHEATRINALVIDFKDDHGALLVGGPFSAIVRNARRRDIRTMDLKAMLRHLHDNGTYAIARIVVFKDDLLVRTHPDLALKGDDGIVLRENDRIAWADPRKKSVRDYNLAIAITAADLGFDEIQFDYIRFPVVSAPARISWTEYSDTRRAAIRGFLAEARTRLAPYNVFVAADIFGYASWDRGDTNIGQNLEDIAAEVDYVCPMLYPSSFRKGIPASPMPLNQPDKIVNLSLQHAQQRTGLPRVRFRPWLQAFADFNFDRRSFGRSEIGLQTTAADDFGSDGWMLWQPHSIYSAEDMP